jgi:hypothetical protein
MVHIHTYEISSCMNSYSNWEIGNVGLRPNQCKERAVAPVAEASSCWISIHLAALLGLVEQTSFTVAVVAVVAAVAALAAVAAVTAVGAVGALAAVAAVAAETQPVARRASGAPVPLTTEPNSSGEAVGWGRYDGRAQVALRPQCSFGHCDPLTDRDMQFCSTQRAWGAGMF